MEIFDTAGGGIDPGLMARLRRFAQPSEIQEPFELLRAGIVFHAREMITPSPSSIIRNV